MRHAQEAFEEAKAFSSERFYGELEELVNRVVSDASKNGYLTADFDIKITDEPFVREGLRQNGYTVTKRFINISPNVQRVYLTVSWAHIGAVL
jgi:hypothetical protein